MTVCRVTVALQVTLIESDMLIPLYVLTPCDTAVFTQRQYA